MKKVTFLCPAVILVRKWVINCESSRNNVAYTQWPLVYWENRIWFLNLFIGKEGKSVSVY